MCDSYFAWPLPKIRKAEDWNRVEPLPADHPFIREQVERAAAIVKEIGKERCVFYNVFAPFSSNSMVGIPTCFFLSCGMLNWSFTPLNTTQVKLVTFLLFPFTHEGIIDCVSYITLNVLCELLLLAEFHYTEIHLLGSFLYTQLCVLCTSYLLFPSSPDPEAWRHDRPLLYW